MKNIFLTLITMLCLTSEVQAQQSLVQTPFVVPSLHNWKAAKGNETFNIFDIENITVDRDVFTHAAKMVQSRLERMKDNVNIVDPKTKPDPSATIRFSLAKDKKLGQEGYTLSISPKGIDIKALTAKGAVWGAQTLFQLIDEGSKQLPCGTTVDKPEYALRGFMIDCGRKYIPMDYLRRLVRCMSYYKMNTLQVHLNDNGFKKYFHNNWDETYAAFRLESELFPDLTARDGYYTKQEFREFIKWAETLGVEIIPEIDAPAHALAFTHFRPEFGNPEFGIDHLDLSNPGVIPFLDSLYSEYLGGPDPVFAGPRVHIGTDEYSNKKKESTEQFRNFTNHYIRLVKQYGKQPKLWGSLTWSKGDTPVEVDGVLMDCWSNDFAQPDSMKQLGYQLVSIPDGWVYIVPAAGYYYDYLYEDLLYNKWTPANINGKQFPEHDPQIEGGMFAVWNDVCGNGISTFDIHHRVMPALKVMAQKCWSAAATTLPFEEWQPKARKMNDEPGFTWGRPLWRSSNSVNVRPNSQLELPQTDLGYGYSVSFDIEAAKEQMGTTLFESDFAKFYISDPVTGRLGYWRDGYLFTFDYALRPGEKHKLRIEGTNKETRLYVDGRLRQTLGYDERLAADKKPYNIVRTLAFPIERTGNFKSTIRNLSIKRGE